MENKKLISNGEKSVMEVLYGMVSYLFAGMTIFAAFLASVYIWDAVSWYVYLPAQALIACIAYCAIEVCVNYKKGRKIHKASAALVVFFQFLVVGGAYDEYLYAMSEFEMEEIAEESSDILLFEGVDSYDLFGEAYDRLSFVSPSTVSSKGTFVHDGYLFNKFLIEQIVGTKNNNIVLSFYVGVPEELPGRPWVGFRIETEPNCKKIIYRVHAGMEVQEFSITINKKH